MSPVEGYSVPRMTVPAAVNQPLVPLTQASLASGTWRAPALAPELLDRLNEQEHPPHAGLAGGQAAAVGVGRERAADAEPAVLDEGAALALLAEAEALEGQDAPSA